MSQQKSFKLRGASDYKRTPAKRYRSQERRAQRIVKQQERAA